MSISAEIFTFPGRNGGGNGGAWGNQDLADVYRCIDQFARQGMVLEAASGLSDEGDPWFALEETATGETLVHIARIDGFYIVQVMDGDTWRGDTLRAALSGLDLGALPFDADPGPVDGPQGEDGADPDGSHAFLRIVSAVIAVLTADVIASAVAHDAMASPLPDVSETVAGDHAHDNISHTFALPDVHVQQEHAFVRAEKTEAPVEPAASPTPQQRDAEEPHHPAALTAVAEPATEIHIDIPTPTQAAAPAPVVKIEINLPHALAAAQAEAPQLASGERLHIAIPNGDSDVVQFEATRESDLFLVVTTPDQGPVTIKIPDFQPGQDSVVIEKTTDAGTSSGIILDFSQLASAQFGALTVIGQTNTADEPLAGG